jgi:hypothetical protein
MLQDGFDPAESRLLKKLDSPARIQRFLDEEVVYNREENGATCRSPRRVLRDRKAQCVEGAVFAAAALRAHGWEPLLVDLEAVNDDDHVLAVYRCDGHWGAIAKSNYSGLRFREAVYRDLRELVMSYFEHYFNLRKHKTLRAYSNPVNLNRFNDLKWTTSEKDLWEIPEYLVTVPHKPVLTRAMERRLNPMDRRLFSAGCLGHLE